MSVPSPQVDAPTSPAPAGRPIRHLRWWICGLLFFATMINYVDRQTVSVLNPTMLKKEIGWDDAGFGWIMFSFQLAYALMFPISGRLLDRFGVRAGMMVAVVVWSFAAMAHAFARSPFGFALARFFLGLGEAANFPGCVKAVAEWFPKRQRAFATGIFNAGTNVGVMLSPAIVAVAMAIGWKGAFLVTGALGFVWLFFWWLLYRSPADHPRLSAEERALIQSDHEPEPKAAKIPWPMLLRYRQAWAFFLGKAMTDPVWWFYLYWLPSYLNKERGLTALTASVMLVWPYLAADVGSVLGGWLSGFLMKRGWSTGRARQTAMFIYALGMPSAIWAVLTDDFYVALTLISLATMCHQAWSANMFTLASDMFPKRAVGSVVGLGSMCGAIGGMFMTLVAGGMLQWLGSYVPLFIIAGVMHPAAWLVIRGLAGKQMAPAELDGAMVAERSPVLMASGAALAVLGTVLAGAVLFGWQTIVTAARSQSTAAAGLVASLGVAIIGLVLLYAARGRTRAG